MDIEYRAATFRVPVILYKRMAHAAVDSGQSVSQWLNVAILGELKRQDAARAIIGETQSP